MHDPVLIFLRFIKRNRDYILAAMVFLTFMWSISYFWVQSYTAAHENKAKEMTQNALFSKRVLVEAEVDNLLYIPKAISAYAISSGRLDSVYFVTVAKEMSVGVPYFINISIAPDNVARFIYPHAGNEKVLGFNFMDHPVQSIDAQRAVKYRNPVLSGPIDLVQGGKGLILRYPIFIQNQAGDFNYWGMASLVMDYNQFIKELIRQGLIEDLEVTMLIGNSELPYKPVILYGNMDTDELNFVSEKVFISATDWIELRTYLSKTGPEMPRSMLFIFALVFLLEFLFALLILLLLIRQRSLRGFLRENEQLNSRLRETNQFQVRLYSIIAHDLRGPIKNLVSLSELLSAEAKMKSDVSPVNLHIEKSVKALHSFSESLLNWASSQLNEFTFEPANHLAKELLDEAWSILEYTSSEKSVKLNMQIEDDLFLYGDRNMLLVIFRNLMSNAIKYSPREGVITLSAKAIDQGNSEITIKDKGNGMPAAILKRLQSGTLVESQPGTIGEKGTGFGLLLCRELVAYHSGTIEIESDKSGTKVTVQLPFFKVMKITNESH